MRYYCILWIRNIYHQCARPYGTLGKNILLTIVIKSTVLPIKKSIRKLKLNELKTALPKDGIIILILICINDL